MKVMDRTMQGIAHALNYRQVRQEVISSNIANAETPGFRSKRVDFEKALQNALELEKANSLNTNNGRHYDVGEGGFDHLSPEIYEDPNGVVSENGNTVERDKELARMAENKVMYDAAVQLMNKKFGLLKYAVNSER